MSSVPKIKFDWEKHTVTTNGSPVMLNPRLVMQQDLSLVDTNLLLLTHATRSSLFQAMEQTDDSETLQRYDRAYKHLQMCQQELWKFGADPNYLRPWDVPKCKCPRLDNEDLHGTPYGPIINSDCTVHWPAVAQRAEREKEFAQTKSKLMDVINEWESTDKSELLDEVLDLLSEEQLNKIAEKQGAK